MWRRGLGGCMRFKEESSVSSNWRRPIAGSLGRQYASARCAGKQQDRGMLMLMLWSRRAIVSDLANSSHCITLSAWLFPALRWEPAAHRATQVRQDIPVVCIIAIYRPSGSSFPITSTFTSRTAPPDSELYWGHVCAKTPKTGVCLHGIGETRHQAGPSGRRPDTHLATCPIGVTATTRSAPRNASADDDAGEPFPTGIGDRTGASGGGDSSWSTADVKLGLDKN